MEASTARAWVDVDLGALVDNARAIAARAGVPLLPMVKANAYGLGAVAVVHALDAAAATGLPLWGYGVATIQEGAALRTAGVGRPIVVFTPLLVADLAAAAAADLTPTLHREPEIRCWATFDRPWHLAIDTGMSRAGVRWDAVSSLTEVLRACPPAGAFTHFHSADDDGGSRLEQERRFEIALAALPARPPCVHTESSPAIERGGVSRWSIARPGIFLYGAGIGADLTPRPVVGLRARVVDVRQIGAGETVSYSATYRAPSTRRIATVAAGYADGYRRSFSGRAVALVQGRRVPVVGLITMDMTMIDVTDVAAELGDVATLIGTDGADALDLGEVAAWGALSPYEVLTGLGLRAPHRYLRGAELDSHVPLPLTSG